MAQATGRKVVFYETASGRSPVREFLGRDCNEVQEARVSSAIDLLEKAGSCLGPPTLKKVEGEIWELRVWSNRVRIRVLFCEKGDSFVLLHALKKEKDKLPRRDIETAKRRCREY